MRVFYGGGDEILSAHTLDHPNRVKDFTEGALRNLNGFWSFGLKQNSTFLEYSP